MADLIDQDDVEEADKLLNLNAIRQQCTYYSSGADLKIAVDFSIIHFNARSLKNKFDDFQTFLATSGVEWSVICVSETWLKTDILEYFNLDSYNLYASCRSTGEGGGTAIYVNRKIDSNERPDLSDSDLEDVFVELDVRMTNCRKKYKV